MRSDLKFDQGSNPTWAMNDNPCHLNIRSCFIAGPNWSRTYLVKMVYPSKPTWTSTVRNNASRRIWFVAGPRWSDYSNLLDRDGQPRWILCQDDGHHLDQLGPAYNHKWHIWSCWKLCESRLTWEAGFPSVFPAGTLKEGSVKKRFPAIYEHQQPGFCHLLSPACSPVCRYLTNEH